MDAFINVMCMPGAGGGQERASDPLDLESQRVPRHPVGAGNPAQGLYKSSQCS